MSIKRTYDIQGRCCGIPYDFRRPTLAKFAARMYLPSGPLLVPRVFGAGWTLNLAHRGSRALVALMCCAMIVALLAA